MMCWAILGLDITTLILIFFAGSLYRLVFVQMTFSEKGAKNTLQTRIRNFEILRFLDNISKIILIQNFSVRKSVPCQPFRIKEKLHYEIDSMFKFEGFQIFFSEFGE